MIGKFKQNEEEKMDKTELLKQYKELRDEGAISEEEFSKFKEGIVYDQESDDQSPTQTKPSEKGNKSKIIIIVIIAAMALIGVIAKFALGSSSSKQVDKMPLPFSMSDEEVYQYIEENGYDATQYINGDVAGDLYWFGMDNMFRVYAHSEGSRPHRIVYVEPKDGEKVLKVLKKWYGEEQPGYYESAYIWQIDDMVIEYRIYTGSDNAVEVTYFTKEGYEDAYNVTL